MRLLLTILLICLTAVTGAVSCNGRSGPAASVDSPSPGLDGPAQEVGEPLMAQFRLTAPADLAQLLPAPRGASYIPADLLREGEAFSGSMPHQRVTATASGALFEPAYPDNAAGFPGLAFCKYEFQLPGYSGDATLHFNWSTPPPAGELWLALADFDNNRWVWYKPANSAQLTLPSLQPYLRSGMDLLVCVLRTGTAASELDWLRVGSLPPAPELTASIGFGLPPFTVNFNASDSTDADGTIAEYRWDPEGDGSFDETSGEEPVFSFEYTTNGKFNAAVRVIDNNNVYADTSLSINALAEGPFTYGSDVAKEDVRCVVVCDDGSMALFGTYQQLADPEYQVFAARVARGTAFFCKLWGGENSDHLFDAARGPDGYIYTCGASRSFGDGGDQDALLQQWTQTGEVLYSFGIGHEDWNEQFTALIVQGDSIYASGWIRDRGTNRDFGLLCRFNLQGALIWSRSMIAPANCRFNDLVFYAPTTPDPATIRVCGSYQPMADDDDCVYAEYDTDGNLLACRVWGAPAYDEQGTAVNIPPGITGTTYVAGNTTAEGVDATAFFGRPGSAMVQIAAASPLTAKAISFPAVVLERAYFSTDRSVVAKFNSSLELLTQKEFYVPTGGGTEAWAARYLPGGGLLTAGSHWGPLHQETQSSLSVTPSALSWTDAFPLQGSPVFGIQELKLQLIDISGDQAFDRGSSNADAYVNLIRP